MRGPAWYRTVHSPKTRTYSGWADDLVTIADALGYHEFGVTGSSEGGPWALAAAAYIDPNRLRHVSSIAGASYGTFGENWAKDYLSKIDALGDFSHCILNLASASCMRPLT
jgi:pimeloyl-ACP methyl ester carboxylesterase